MRVGELVAQILERERAALRHRAGVADRLGQIAEQRRALRGRADVALGVPAERASGCIERRLQADAGERVVERLELRRGVADPAAGDHSQAAGARGVESAAVLALLGRIEVALHLGVDRLGAQRAGRGDQLVGRAGGQRDEPAAEVRELHERHPALALLAAVVAQGEQPAEVLVALAVLAQERQGAGPLDFQLGPDERAHAGVARRRMEARRAVDAAHVGQPEDRVPCLGGRGGEVLGKRGSVQEAEGAARVQLDEVSGRR